MIRRRFHARSPVGISTKELFDPFLSEKTLLSDLDTRYLPLPDERIKVTPTYAEKFHNLPDREELGHELFPRLSFVIFLAHYRLGVPLILKSLDQQIAPLWMFRPQMDCLAVELGNRSQLPERHAIDTDIFRCFTAALLNVMEDSMTGMADRQEIGKVMIRGCLIYVVNHPCPFATDFAFTLNGFQFFNTDFFQKIMVLIFRRPAVPSRVRRTLHRWMPINNRRPRSGFDNFLFAHSISLSDIRIQYYFPIVNTLPKKYPVRKPLIITGLLTL